MKTKQLELMLNDLHERGQISFEAYNVLYAAIEDDEPNGDSFLPDTYAEIEYDDMDTPEALMGSRFDDMNFLRYLER